MSDTKPNREERTMAALAHGSVALFGMGVIAAVAIWTSQKEKSPYVAFQALQATVYQGIGILVSMVSWCCWTALYFLSLIPLMTAADASGDPPAIFFLSLALMVVPLALMGVWVLAGLWGAVRTLQGRDFHYLVIGPALERWLESD